MGKTVFDVKQLNASYGKELVLKNLDFSIAEGEVIGIMVSLELENRLF